jgi:lipopolysaccharide transport system permease protein
MPQVDSATLTPERAETIIRPPAFGAATLLRRLRVLARHRDLLYTLTLHRIRVRYKQSLLGPAWAVLQPLATMAVLTVVFAYIARVPVGGESYVLIALAGLVPWTCFSNALTTATQSLVSNAQLVTRVYFPREILPITYVIAALVDCAVAALVLEGLLIWYGRPFAANPTLTLAAVLVLVCLTTALALLLSATQVYVRDIGVAMPILLQLLLFASPVAYPLAIVPERFRDVYSLNPLVGIIENFRRGVLGTAPPEPFSLLVSATWAVVLLPFAYAWFKHLEATAADVV